MKIVFTPDWFLGSDVLIEIFSFFILALFVYFCFKYYKLTKKNKFLYLGAVFLLIAVAELSTIFTKVVLYYDTTFTQAVGEMIVTYNVVNSVDIFYYLGFFIHKLFTLGGFYILYKLSSGKNISISDFFIGIYFLIISVLFSAGFYYLFHLTALVLLWLVVNNYLKIYKKNKSINTKILIIAFLLLALSQIIFILSKVGVLYALAQLIQLVSYITLLVLIINILKHGKKKKSYRHNL